eukprot:TRINITY_DN60819_c0_g1_i1.p3 TRINITY_DN60819_c0_g1~~TRINITY_DN60819_c0_g1_i1.p3  ORF type:complete len:119 (-),score=6.94 TRINITY_DN60819_c0_g1_i1:213-569(-)
MSSSSCLSSLSGWYRPKFWRQSNDLHPRLYNQRATQQTAFPSNTPRGTANNSSAKNVGKYQESLSKCSSESSKAAFRCVLARFTSQAPPCPKQSFDTSNANTTGCLVSAPDSRRQMYE